MSKEIVKQEMKMKCEACGVEKIWDLVGADDKPEVLREMEEWYQVVHRIVHPQTGQLVPLMGDACSLACVSAVAVKLAVPDDAVGLSNQVDLAALRSQNFEN
jgi:hypothetical protein